MTAIPGTEELKSTISPQTPEKAQSEALFTVVNVNELKSPKKEPEEYEPDVWYNQLRYWMAFGSIFSVFFGILAFYNWKLLFLLPLGPYVAYLTFHIKKMIKKHTNKFDVLS